MYAQVIILIRRMAKARCAYTAKAASIRTCAQPGFARTMPAASPLRRRATAPPRATAAVPRDLNCEDGRCKLPLGAQCEREDNCGRDHFCKLSKGVCRKVAEPSRVGERFGGEDQYCGASPPTGALDGKSRPYQPLNGTECRDTITNSMCRLQPYYFCPEHLSERGQRISCGSLTIADPPLPLYCKDILGSNPSTDLHTGLRPDAVQSSDLQQHGIIISIEDFRALGTAYLEQSRDCVGIQSRLLIVELEKHSGDPFMTHLSLCQLDDGNKADQCSSDATCGQRKCEGGVCRSTHGQTCFGDRLPCQSGNYCLNRRCVTLPEMYLEIEGAITEYKQEEEAEKRLGGSKRAIGARRSW